MPDDSNAPRQPLTEERIVAVALDLADGDGIAALSMRRVAQRLNVSAMALYNHVADKDALIDRMLSHVVAQFARPVPGDPWPDALRSRARSMRAAFLRHPWALPLLMSRIVLTDEILADHDAVLGCLLGAGLSPGQADWVRNAVDGHVYGYTMQELNMPVAPESYRAAATEALPRIDAAHYPHMHAASRAIAVGDYDGLTRFGFGLDIMLRGLERWIAAGGRHDGYGH